MAGHSKWSQIKHKKAVADKKKAAIFAKISRLISVAVKEKGDADPETNPKLRMAITMAQEANMPKGNIERSIEKASGKGEGQNLEEIFIEAYGPGGVALIIKTITDNRNRTLAEIRHILNKHQGKVASEGAVMWLFENVGRISVNSYSNEEELGLIAIELGAQDIKKEVGEKKEKLVIITKPEDLDKIKISLKEKGVLIKEVMLDLIPKGELVSLDENLKEGLEKLFSDLDEQDDVQEIYSNLKN